MNEEAKTFDVKKLDDKVTVAYMAMPDAIKLLVRWVELPDMHMYTELKDIAEQLKAIKPLPEGTNLFRGFYPTSAYQDTMGLMKRDWLGAKVKPHHIGESYEYALERPLSFTTDQSMAEAYGSTVVQLHNTPDAYIWITDELNLLIATARRKEAKSEKEVIVLPPYDARFTIVKA
jgi:hypothetical protein